MPILIIKLHIHYTLRKKSHGHPKKASKVDPEEDPTGDPWGDPKFEGISEWLSQIITQYLGGILENNDCLLLQNIMLIGPLYSCYVRMRGLYLSQWVNRCNRKIVFNLKIWVIESVISIEILPQIITQYLGGILENNECLLLRNIMSIGTFIFLLCPDEGALFDQRSMHNNG